jgi:UDP-N-acetylglucosamine--N-acetylmuramyl-(pentapeptide) pyrophosphoryl-undecaprenol N-acetylglucosamine transferase
MKEAKRFIIAGGGTGGHIFPAIAIANALQKLSPTSEFLFVGAEGKMEMEKIPQAGFKIVGLSIVGFNRSSLIKNIALPIKLLKSFFQVSRIISTFKPDAVIGVGGYSTYPMLRFAQWKKIPTFIHEANSYAGKSNQLLGKRAAVIFTATDNMESFFPKEKIVVSGNPVRSEIVQGKISKEEAFDFFGFQPHQKVIMVIGGSLGAKTINETIARHIKIFQEQKLQLLWQTGSTFYEVAKGIAAGEKNIFVTDFISNMDKAYAAADIVISRSGAMSIAELCVVKKPVLFIPFPYAAEDHQKANAMKLVQKKAALMIEDSRCLNELVPELIKLAKDENLQSQLIDNIQKLSIEHADSIIADTIIKTIH